jgi:Nif-specific regulatory protein
MPALRERRSDILQLTDFFIGRFNAKHDKSVKRVSTPAIDMLLAYHWPGNVRELENCIDRAILLSDDDVIHGHHLPPTLQTAEASGTRFKGTLAEAVARLEKEMIVEALKDARGNRASAARTLGISERVMGLRCDSYNIDARRFKPRG